MKKAIYVFCWMVLSASLWYVHDYPMIFTALVFGWTGATLYPWPQVIHVIHRRRVAFEDLDPGERRVFTYCYTLMMSFFVAFITYYFRTQYHKSALDLTELLGVMGGLLSGYNRFKDPLVQGTLECISTFRIGSPRASTMPSPVDLEMAPLELDVV